MSQIIIDIGNAPDDGLGTPLRQAFSDINAMFTEVYGAGPANSNIAIANNTITTTRINGNIILAPSGIGVVQTNTSIVPRVDNVYNLGSPSQRWDTLYLGLGGFDSIGNVSANYFIGNGSQLTGVLAAAGPEIVFGNSNVSIPTVDGNITFSVNSQSNLVIITQTSALINLPIVSSNRANFVGNVTANSFFGNFIGNVSGTFTAPGSNTNVLFNDEGNVGADPQFNWYKDVNLLDVLGNVEAYNLSLSENLSLTGNIVAVGNATVGNLIVNNSSEIFGNLLVDNNIEALGEINSETAVFNSSTRTNTLLVVANANVGTTLSVGGNIQGANISTAGNVTSNSITVTSNATVSGTGNVVNLVSNTATIASLSVTTVSASGNVTGGNINTSGVISASGNIVTDTSVVAPSANLYSSTVALTAVGAIVGSSNISGNNINSQNIVSAVGNVIGGNLLTTGVVSASSVLATALVSTSGNVIAAANVVGGNIRTTGVVSSTGNIVTDGNISAAGNITATGNITAPWFLGNVIGNISGNFITPGSNTQVIFNDGGIANASAGFTFDKSSDSITVAGNVNGGNLYITGSGVVDGNLTINGNLTYINVENLNVEDPIIGIGRGPNNSPLTINDGKDRGEQLWYYSGSEKSAFIGYDNSAANLIMATDVTITNEIVTVNNYGNLTLGNITSEYIVSTANVTGGNLVTGGVVTAVGNVISAANIQGANIVTGGVVTATGNVIAGNINSLGIVSAVGNIVTTATANVGTLVVTGAADVTGNLVGSNISASGQISATGNIIGSANISGNFVAAGSNRQVMFNDNGLISSSSLFTFDKAGPTLTLTNTAGTVITAFVSSLGGSDLALTPATGIVVNWANSNPRFSNTYTLGTSTFQWRNIWAGNANIGSASVVGNINSGNIITAGIANIGTLEVTGNAAVVGNASVTANLSAGNISTAGQVSATGNVIANAVQTTNNINVGTNIDAGGYAQITGNITGGNLITTGLISATGNIIGGNVTTTNLSLTGNVLNNLNVSGNVTANAVTTVNNITIGTTADVTGNLTAGNISTAGNVVASNVNATNLSLTGNVLNNLNVSGNVTANAVTTVNNIAVGTNANVTGNVQAGGNVNAGNVNSTNEVISTGNVTGGNINTAGIVSATGNVKGNWLVAQANVEVLGNKIVSGTTTGLLFEPGNVSLISGNLIVNGGFIYSQNGDTAIELVNNGEIGSIGIYNNLQVGKDGQGNIDAAGYANITGNLTVGGTASVTGNISGGNLNTAGQLVATGNTTGGNLITSGIVTATGNINTSANVNAANLVSANINAPTSGITISAAAGGDYNIYLVPTGNGTVDTGDHRITNVGTPQAPDDAATKQYVDDAVTSGIHIHEPVRLETSAALTATYANGGTTVTVDSITGNKTLTFTTSPALSVDDLIVFTNSFNGLTANTAYFVYSTNGSNQVTLSTSFNGVELTGLTDGGPGLAQPARVNSGIGATLTNAGANVAFSADSTTANVADRILVYNQANSTWNGVYVVSTAGNASVQWVLTRASDADYYSPSSTNGASVGDYFYVTGGATGAGESYVLTDPTGPIIFGYSNITYTQFSASQVYSGANGIAITGAVITANVDNDTTAIVSGNITVKAGANLTTPNIGAATGTSLSVTGNINANNIALVNYVSAGTIDATANITGGNIISNGAASITGNTSTGNLLVNNEANVSGNLHALGNTQFGQPLSFVAAQANMQYAGTANSYVQFVMQNKDNGINASTDIVATADNGTDSDTYIDMGINSSAYNQAAYELAGPNDGYLLVFGNTTTGGGKLVLSTFTNNDIVFSTGGGANVNEAGRFEHGNGFQVSGNVSGNYFFGNGALLTGITTGAPYQIINSNTDVTIPSANSNVLVTVNGTSNVVIFANTGVYVSGQVSASGNVTGNYILGNGALLTGVITSVANINSGNSNVRITTAGGNVAANVGGTANVWVLASTGEYVTGEISASGNITGANFIGNANATSLTSGIVPSARLTGTYSINISGLAATANTVTDAAQPNITSVGTLTSLSVSGNTTSGNLLTGGQLSATGNITSLANIIGGNIETAGNIDGANINASGIIYGQFYAPGGNRQVVFNDNNLANADSGFTYDKSDQSVTVTGNVSGGNVVTAGVVTATGNITGNFFHGNGYYLTGIITSVANINNGTSNVRIDSSGGNILANVGGTANVITIATTGLYVNGEVSATGNVTGNYILGNGSLLSGIITSVANINNGTSNLRIDTSGGNILANVGGTANIFAITTVGIETTGNISGNNISISNSASVSGSLSVSGNLTVNGNVTYVNVEDLNVEDPIIGLGRGPNNTPLTTNDGKDRGEQLWYYSGSEKSAFIGYDDSVGKLIAATDVTITNEIVSVNAYGNLVVGGIEAATVSATGNVTGGNIRTGGLISATGNVTGNYFLGNGSQLTGIASISTVYSTISVQGNVAGNSLGNVTINASNVSGVLSPIAGNGINIVGNASSGALTISVLGSVDDGIFWGSNDDAGLVTASIDEPNVDNGLVTDGSTSEYDLGTLEYSTNAVFTNVTSNIIPGTPSIYTIGNTLFPFLEIYTSGNITTSSGYFIGNGALLTGVVTNAANINNGTSNITVTSSGGNIAVSVAANSNVAVFANGSTTFKGNVLPAADNVYSLGSSSAKWANLWVSGNTINLGNIVLKDSGANSLAVYGSDGSTPGTFVNTAAFGQNNPNITANSNISATYNSLSAGPVTINSGVTVTVNSGAYWTIV